MLLDRTISQLDIGTIPADEARQLGQFGYMQWLAGVPGGVAYRDAALGALERAQPFAANSPAVAEFCGLLAASLARPLTVLPLEGPKAKRRGGARLRRLRRLSL